jgi:hypothetical protein
MALSRSQKDRIASVIERRRQAAVDVLNLLLCYTEAEDIDVLVLGIKRAADILGGQTNVEDLPFAGEQLEEDISRL